MFCPPAPGRDVLSRQCHEGTKGLFVLRKGHCEAVKRFPMYRVPTLKTSHAVISLISRFLRRGPGAGMGWDRYLDSEHEAQACPGLVDEQRDLRVKASLARLSGKQTSGLDALGGVGIHS